MLEVMEGENPIEKAKQLMEDLETVADTQGSKTKYTLRKLFKQEQIYPPF